MLICLSRKSHNLVGFVYLFSQMFGDHQLVTNVHSYDLLHSHSCNAFVHSISII